MSQDVKLYIFQQIHTPSGNRLTGSYFCSVTGYDKQTSFTALPCIIHNRAASGGHSYMCSALIQQGVMVDARDKEG